MIVQKVLLIDDSPGTNNLNKRIILRNDIAKKVDTCLNGQEGINYLLACTVEELPELIFLDMNMPVLDGIGFLEEFIKLPKEIQDNVVVVAMLTNSLTDKDAERIKNYGHVKLRVEKPLNIEKLDQILKESGIVQNP